MSSLNAKRYPLNPAAKRHLLRIIIPAYPAFNIYSHVACLTTALGPVCVASSANELEGWDVEVIDENNLRLYGPKDPAGGADHEFLQKERPADVVGFYGGLSSTIPRVYELAKFYKDKGVTTLAGGQHFVAENIAEALNSDIDYLVLGEGEETIKELLTALAGQGRIEEVAGLAFKQKEKTVFTPARDLLTDFAKLPVPDFSLLRYAKIKLYPIGRVRGCGMDCEFCTVKGKPRCASPERLVECVKQLLEKRDARHFFIVDDLFGQRGEEDLRLCAMLKDYQRQVRKRLDFTAQIRLDKAKDPKLLKAMRQAGINTVAIGFESPIEEELKAMNKHIRARDMVDLARIYNKFGFLVHGMFIFGYPLKDAHFHMGIKERIRRFRRFIREARIDTVQLLLPVPLPGTGLYQRLAEQHRIYALKDIGWKYYDGNFPLFEPDPPLTADDLQLGIRKINSSFYRFRNLFKIGINILLFPAIVFYLYDIKAGWKKWYRPWRNDLDRFGGWIIMRGWTQKLKSGTFFRSLKNAKDRLALRASLMALNKRVESSK